jgi:outer membrane protein TolC
MFDDLLLLDAEIAAADGFAEAWRTMAARVKERVEQAAGTAIDESSTELYTVHAELIAAELRMRRSNAVGALLDRLGLDPRSTPSLAGDPPLAWPPPRLPAERALVEAALRTSPRIAGAAAAVDGADANAYLERSKRWPWLTFVDLGYEFGPGNPAGRAFTVQAGVEVPLFHTNGGGARAAEANLEARRRALVSQAEDITREVRDKLREVQAAEALVDQFRARALPAFERSTREAQQALDASGINVIRMLTLNERRQFVELRYLGLVRRHRAAVAALRRAVGGPLPAP